MSDQIHPNPDDFVDVESISPEENSAEPESIHKPIDVAELPHEELPSKAIEDESSIPSVADGDEEIPIGEIQRDPTPSKPRPHRETITERGKEHPQEFTPEFVRQQRSGRLAIFPLAMGLIGLGMLMVASTAGWIPSLDVTAPSAIVILLGALTLTFVFRFFLSGRRERGLFFIALVMMMWGLVIALDTLSGGNFPLDEYYPLFLGGVGIAFFFTFLFERTHQVGLILPGVTLIFASGVALSVTRDLLSEDFRNLITDYYPLIFTLIGLTLLPVALRRKIRHA